jgi:Zn finger protein HypA/HybF involved in hydrogenase expression
MTLHISPSTRTPRQPLFNLTSTPTFSPPFPRYPNHVANPPTPSPNPDKDPLELNPTPAPPPRLYSPPDPHAKNPLLRGRNRPAPQNDGSGWDDTPEDGSPTCSYCSFNLTGLGITGICPECGYRFDISLPKPKALKLKRKPHAFMGLKGNTALWTKFAFLYAAVILTWSFHKLVPHSTLAGDWALWGHYAGAAVWSFLVIWATTLAWWALDYIESKQRLHPWTVVILSPVLSTLVAVFLWPLSIFPTLAVGAVMGLLRVAKVRLKPYIPIRFRCEVCEFPLDGNKIKGDCPKCTAPYDLARAEEERSRGQEKIRHMYCRKCEYELTGLRLKGPCPECGEPYNLSDPSTRLSIVQLANRRRSSQFLISQLIASLILLISGNYLIYAACSIASSANSPAHALSYAGIMAIGLPITFLIFISMVDNIISQPLGFGFGKTLFVCIATPLLISATALLTGTAVGFFLIPMALICGLIFGVLFARKQLGEIRA